MLKLPRVLASLLVGLLMVTAAVVLAGPSAAAPVSSTVAAPFARPTPPCGRKHYPPCPPKKRVSVSPTHVRRGHYVFITVAHYPAHSRVTAHLAGHGRYIFLGSTTTDRHGNARLSVRIPKHIPLGHYTLYVQIGSTTRSFGISVIRG